MKSKKKLPNATPPVFETDDFSCMNAAKESVFAVDHQLKYIKGNQAFCEFMKEVSGPDLFAGQGIMDAGIPGHIAGKWKACFDSVMKEKKAASVDIEIASLTDPVCMEYSFSPVFSENKDVKSVLVIGRDITARKKTERLLVESDQESRALLEAIPDMVFRLTRQGTIQYFKGDVDDLYSSVDTFLGKSIHDVMPDWFSKLVCQHIESVLSSGKMRVFEYQMDVPGRGRQYYECRMVRYSDLEVLAMVRNMTRQKVLEKGYIENEARARSILEATSDVFILLDKDGIVLDCNESHAKRLQMTRDALIGKNVFDFLPEDAALKRRSYIDQVIGSGEPAFFEDYRAGYWNEVAIYPVYHEGHLTEHVAVYAKDITTRKEAEEALRISEDRLAKTLMAANDGMWDWNLVTNHAFFDSRYYTMAGYEVNEFPHSLKAFQERVHPDDLPNVMEAASMHLSGKNERYRVEFRFRKKDGQYMWVLGRGIVVERDEAGTPVRFIGTHQDITLRKLAQQEVAASEQKFRSLFESLPQGIFYQAADGKGVDANDAALRMFGLTRDQFFGKDSYDPQWKVIDENHKILSPAEHPSMVALATGKPVVDQTVGVYSPETDTFNWFIVNAFPEFQSGQDAPYQVFASMQDITQRKLAEESLLASEAHLRQIIAQKDKLFSIISHDLKSPFNVILGFSEVMIKQIRQQKYTGIENYAEKIMLSSNRAMELLTNLLDWARAQTGRIEFKKEKIDLTELIAGVLSVFENLLNQKSISIENRIPAGSIWVDADKNMLSSIFRNVIANAIKYSFRGGDVVISARTLDHELMISITDHGVGIPKDQLSKLFEIGENLSTPGTNHEQGTGLGLSICKDFIERHGGRIWVESVEGEGSTVSFSLPVNEPSVVDRNGEA